MSKVARNAPCPCGSGKKAKKCHESLVGASVAGAEWYLGHLTFIEQCDGYVPPPSGDDGWSVRNYRETGCPFGEVCTHDTDHGGRCASPTCGV